MYISRTLQTSSVTGDFLRKILKKAQKPLPVYSAMAKCPNKVDLLIF